MPLLTSWWQCPPHATTNKMANEVTDSQQAAQEAAKQPGEDAPPVLHRASEEEGRLTELQTAGLAREREQLQTAFRDYHEVVATVDQHALVAQGGDAAVVTQRDDWRDAEIEGRCPENHYGWKPWCEDAISETAIAHFAVCHARDGTVWTRTSADDGTYGAVVAREMWDQSFPLFRYSGDAQRIIRKMTAEACWATGGEAGRRLCEAETRLAFAASYHARLSEHNVFNHLPWDILDQIQKWLRPEHQLLCAQGSSLTFQGESWVVLRFEPCTNGAAMLIARRDQKGLTAFRTAQSLVVALVDERARDYQSHGTATNDAGSIVDRMIWQGL